LALPCLITVPKQLHLCTRVEGQVLFLVEGLRLSLDHPVLVLLQEPDNIILVRGPYMGLVFDDTSQTR
jgi:hypothetical protein